MVVEGVEEEVEAEQQQEQLQGEEAMRNSSEQNHPPSTEITKTLTDSFRTSKGTCL